MLRNSLLLTVILCCSVGSAGEAPVPEPEDGEPVDGSSVDREQRGIVLPYSPAPFDFPLELIPLEVRSTRLNFTYTITSDRTSTGKTVFSVGSVHAQPGPWRRFTGCHVALRGGDIIPLYGELYFVPTIGGALNLQRVSDRFPEEILPLPDSLLVMPKSVDTRLFWNASFQAMGKISVVGFDEVVIGETRHATARVVVEPPPNRIYPSALGRRDPPGDFYARVPFSLTVRAGDYVATEFQAYRVRNVVPPQGEIEMPDGLRARVVGWIELDPEPLPPPEEPAEAPEAE